MKRTVSVLSFGWFAAAVVATPASMGAEHARAVRWLARGQRHRTSGVITGAIDNSVLPEHDRRAERGLLAPDASRPASWKRADRARRRHS